MPTLSVQVDTTAAGKMARDDGKLPSAGISSPSWKSRFRLGQGSASSRKLDAPRGAQLTLDLNAQPPPSPTLAPPASPTPTSLSADQRSSYYSSATPSTDSGTAMSPKQSSQPPPTVITTSANIPPTLPPTGIVEPAPKRSKADKQRNLGRGRSKDNVVPQAVSTSTSTSATRSPLSPKAVGASASRFLRRVASAPNTKGLFSNGNRSASAHASPTKNGLLAPGGVVPPLPSTPTAAQMSSDSRNGQPSTDTTSSTSSQGHPVRPKPVRQWSGKKFKTKDRMAALSPEDPGKVAFRRTYSSNSIKVGEVCALILPLVMSGASTDRAAGRSWSEQLPKDQDARPRRCR
jgi:protein-serine/threonine kinase